MTLPSLSGLVSDAEMQQLLWSAGVACLLFAALDRAARPALVGLALIVLGFTIPWPI